ncbi:hypothetical protein FRC15_006131 [Serendipita sp. 397]|nr:hypothetical protein FRC15_006131 [Serendipita sp. 397]
MPLFSSTFLSFWSSQPRRDESVPPHNERLPPELWGIVINFVVDEIRHPYRYCTPATFPQYQARFFLAGRLEKDSTLDDWKSVRLVCRTWKELAGSQPHAKIRRQQLESTTGSLDEVSSIIVNFTATTQAEMRNFLLPPAISSTLTTIIFGPDYTQYGVDILLDNPSAFRTVRCLSLPSAGFRRQFWQELQDGYPQIVSLTIRNFVGNGRGRYTFENLEILDVNAWGIFRLSCPSLKHFSCRYDCSEPVAEFLREHGHQLESFFWDSYSVNPSEMWLKEGHSVNNSEMWIRAPWASGKHVWKLFPNLQTLGLEVKMLFSSPPPEHPLRGLRILSHYHSVTMGSVLQTIQSFPGVTHIHVRPSDLHPDTMDDLRARCAERSVDVVDVVSAKMAPKPPVPIFVMRAAVVFTCPCWFPLFLCSHLHCGAD